MEIHTVRPVAGSEPPQWIIVVADSATPGEPQPVVKIPPFTDRDLAEAEAKRLNAGGV